MKRRFLLLFFVVCTWALANSQQDSWITCMQYAADNRTVACGDAAGTVGIWRDGKRLVALKSHKDWVHGLAVHDRQVVSWARDDSVCVSTLGGRTVHSWKAPTGSDVGGGCLSPNGRQLVTFGGGPALLWDLETGKTRKLDASPTFAQVRIAYSPDGKSMALGFDKAVVVYDSTSGKRVSKLALNNDFVDLAFHSNGQLWSLDKSALRRWQLPAATLLSRLDVSDTAEPVGLFWSPSRERLGVLSEGNTALFEGEQQVALVPAHLVGFSGEDRVLEIPTQNGPINLRPFPSGEPARAISTMKWPAGAPVDIPTDMAISPDGKNLALGRPQFRVISLAR